MSKKKNEKESLNLVNLEERKPKKDIDLELKEMNKKIRQHKNSIITIVTSLIIIAVLIVFGIYQYNKNKTYTAYVVNNKMDSENNIDASYYEFGEYLLKCSTDGITYYKNDKLIWNHGFEMKDLLIDICDSYVAIAQKNTNSIYIFNESGQVGSAEAKFPIKKLQVASQGVVAVVTEDEKVNYIEVIDKKGNQISVGKTVLSGDGYPVDISISQNGEKLIVSYLYVSEGQTQSKVVFYNFSEVGQNEIDNLVGGYNHYKTTIVPEVEFINNDRAIAMGDNMFTIFEIEQKPEITFEKKIDRKIKSVFYSETNIGIILEGDKEDDNYHLIVYDESGNEVVSKEFDLKYKKVKFDKNNILIYNNTEIMIISNKEVVKFDYKFKEDVIDILTTKKDYEYILITNNKIENIVLK